MNIMAIALAIFCRIPVEVHGQSFLKKLKQKVGNVVGTKDDTAEIGEEPFVGGDGDQPTRSVTPTDKLQKRRTATATWDEMIAPSRANSPEALLNELPPLPSVESIVYPEETAPCDLLPQDRSRGYAYNGTGFDTYLLGRGDDRPPG